MARIRSMKPELRTSLTAAQWPREVRYFWSLLWGYLDDHGYGVDDPRLIKADCFPLDDDLTVGDIDKWLDLIASTILGPGDMPPLCRYEANGRRFLHAPKWAEHQRPQHPALPKFPVCARSHETLVNGSGDSHETVVREIGQKSVTAGQHASGESHETLTPEQVVKQGAGSREQVADTRVRACEPRSPAAATLIGNSLLDQHRRQIKPSLPRDVAQKVGEQIDSLLADPEITVEEIREGLARLRSNRKWGPGMLPNLVHEVRQEQAGEGEPRARSPDWRQQADQARIARALQRAQAREGA